jgi:hypothetical protein
MFGDDIASSRDLDCDGAKEGEIDWRFPEKPGVASGVALAN